MLNFPYFLDSAFVHLIKESNRSYLFVFPSRLFKNLNEFGTENSEKYLVELNRPFELGFTRAMRSSKTPRDTRARMKTVDQDADRGCVK